MRKSIRNGSIAACIVLVALIGMRVRFGSLATGLGYFRGERVFPVQSEVNVGAGKPGEIKPISVSVSNIGSQPVTIIGVKTTCGCIRAAEELPARLSPGQTRTFEFSIHFNSDEGGFAHHVTFFSDLQRQPPITVTVIGRTLPAASSSSARSNGSLEYFADVQGLLVGYSF